MSELEYLYSDVSTESKVNEDESDTQLSWFNQKYNLDARKEIFPYLDVHAGGILEMIDQSSTSRSTSRNMTTGLIETDTSHPGSERTRSWLFGEVNLNNPFYTAGVGYRRREDLFNPDNFASTKFYRQEYTGTWRWRPVGFPSLDLDYSHVNNWDADDTRDELIKFLTLKNRYRYENVFYDYTYTRNDVEQKLAKRRTLNQVHNGRAGYSEEFFDDRLSVSAGLQLNYQTLEPSGTGVFERPTMFPATSFLQNDDDPVDPSSGTPYGPNDVNIGEGAPSPVSFILDFAVETTVDGIHVILAEATESTMADPNQIAAAESQFRWRAFTRGSDDTVDWEEIPGSVQATYDRFDNRFDLSFHPSLSAHQIKVQIEPPLSFRGTIFITRLESFTTFEATPGLVLEDFDQSYDLLLGWEFSDRTATSYNGSFRRLESQPFDSIRTTLSNSVDLRHFFNPVFLGNARIMRTDINETNGGDTVQHIYSASLRADYLDTLSQTLVFSGIHDRGEDDTSLRNSIFLRTNADLYSGWGANLDLGYSWNVRKEAPNESTTTVRISTNVIPNRQSNLTLDYQGSWRTQSGESPSYDQNARVQGFWVPVPTLSLFASVGLRDRPSEAHRLTIAQDYSVNWAPFPDGLLDLSLAYNESILSRDRKIRTLSPEINCRITRTILVTLRFNYSQIESESIRQDVQSIRAWFRAAY